MAIMDVIVTRRLCLVPLSLGDAAAIVNGHRPEDARWAEGYPTDGTLVGASMVVTADAEEHDLGPWSSYQVTRREDDLVIGDGGFLGPPDDTGEVHVLFGIVDDERGHGYAQEALRALIEFARGQPGVLRVVAETDPANHATRRVMEAAGMRRVHADERTVYYAA